MADGSYRPLDKPCRIIDQTALETVRRRGYCEFCNITLPDGADPAHIRSRGARGDDTDDNLVSLCRRCHNRHHAGEISAEQLRELVRRRPRETSS